MYTKDKMNRITLRLNEHQFAFVKNNSEVLGISPSEFLRMVVNATMSASQKVTVNAKEVFGRENDEGNSHDKL